MQYYFRKHYEKDEVNRTLEWIIALLIALAIAVLVYFIAFLFAHI